MTVSPATIIVRDVLTLAMRDSGVLAQGQTASAQIMNEGLRRLNMLLAFWNTKRWLTYRLEELYVLSTGADKYAIGPNGSFNFISPDFNNAFNSDFNAVLQAPYNSTSPGPEVYGGSRPVQIESAFARIITNGAPGVDRELQQFASREDWSRVVLKSLVAQPTHFFYDPSMPQGWVYPWPIPTASLYEIHVIVRLPFRPYETLDSLFNVPGEYEYALHWNLCVQLRAAVAKLPPDPVMIGMARDGLNGIRVNNAEVAELKMPTAVRRRSGIYNYLSDQIQ